MKKKIAKNSYYKIYIDEIRNRIYITFYGLWQEVAEVPNFVEDIEKAIQALSSGFTVLADTRSMKTPTKEVDDLHSMVLRIMDKAGLDRLALIIDREILRIAGGRVMREGGIKERMEFFKDTDGAEDWLDG